ncbi:hypothetical protein GT347_17405 [Xylophilus rhododendri]|uniref:Uncharacterized protein n=1 Tax=Xylophilus rhododendri TaxID=2697032 RepID=A0A857J8P4_9BURK|nr:hypothetical protein [Xylophilus rhododendri]QHI99593.1 hypothetical protein GT347_17405 [Xylophilus rhododendri]
MHRQYRQFVTQLSHAIIDFAQPSAGDIEAAAFVEEAQRVKVVYRKQVRIHKLLHDGRIFGYLMHARRPPYVCDKNAPPILVVPTQPPGAVLPASGAAVMDVARRARCGAIAPAELPELDTDNPFEPSRMLEAHALRPLQVARFLAKSGHSRDHVHQLRFFLPLPGYYQPLPLSTLEFDLHTDAWSAILLARPDGTIERLM